MKNIFNLFSHHYKHETIQQTKRSDSKLKQIFREIKHGFRIRKRKTERADNEKKTAHENKKL